MPKLVRILVVVTAVLLAAASGRAGAEDAASRIHAVIASQIKAFQRDDAASAYFHAAPGIQKLFPNPEVFMEMVRTGYGAVYRPRSYVFGPLGQESGKMIQAVRIIGPDGKAVIAHYIMEQQPDGQWKVAGVFLTRSPDAAA